MFHLYTRCFVSKALVRLNSEIALLSKLVKLRTFRNRLHAQLKISKSLPIFPWGTLFFLILTLIFSHICCQTGDPWSVVASKGLHLSWTLLFLQITSQFNQLTSLLALNYSCPNLFYVCRNQNCNAFKKKQKNNKIHRKHFNNVPFSM